MKQVNLSYSVPISIVENLEKVDEALGDSEFTIQGVAISSTVTDNNHKFISEELKKSVSTLVNRPLLKDHNDSVDSIVGRVISAKYDEVGENIKFQARINNTEAGKRVRELIKAGDLSTVSVGAAVREMDEEDGTIIPRGLKFKELSLVATPADDNAQFTFRGNTFDLALKEAWNKVHESNSQKSHSGDLVANNKLNMENDMEKETKIENEVSTPVVEDKAIEVAEVKTESVEQIDLSKVEAKVDALESAFRSQTELLSQVLAKLNELESKETKTESKAVEVKEEVEPVVEVPAIVNPVSEATEKVNKVKESDDEEIDESDLEESEETEESYKVLKAGHKVFTIVQNKYR